MEFDSFDQFDIEYDRGGYDDYDREVVEAAVTAIVDWLLTRHEVDTTRIGLWGVSLGGYYAPRAAAFEKRVKAGHEEWQVLIGICTHLGCTPNWMQNESKFKCPCHGSGFTMQGKNFEGPAPNWLRRYEVSLADDGQIVVNKGRLFFEEKGEFEDPRSFIAV